MRTRYRWQASLGVVLLILVSLSFTAPAGGRPAGGSPAQTASLSGYVNLPDGSPASGATVWYAPMPAGGVYDELLEDYGASTDYYGHFSIGGLAPGTYGLVIEPPENTPTARVLRGVTQQAVEPPSAEPTLTLPAAVKQITGTVVLDGTPQGGVSVYAYGPTSIWPLIATSDPGGSFAFGVEPGTWELSATPADGSVYDSDGRPAIVRFPESSSVETATVTLVLASFSASVAGAVTDAAGAPIESLTVEAVSTESGRVLSSTTSVDGTYSLPVSPGLWEVSVVTNPSVDYYLAEPAAVTVEPVASETLTQDFTLLSGARIDGTFAAGGSPVSDVQGFVYARDAAGEVLASDYAEGGSFTLVLATGAYSLGVDLAPGSAYLSEDEVELSVPPTAAGQIIPASLPLTRSSATITGTLRTASGQALTGVPATVTAFPEDPEAAPQWAEVVETSGSFSLTVTPGTWFLSVAFDDDARHVAPVDPILVTVRADETAAADLTALVRDGVISGVVTDEEGNPLAGEIVWVSNDLFEDVAVTGDDGGFRFAVPLRDGANTAYTIGGDFSCETQQACYLDSLPESVIAVPAGSGGAGLAQLGVKNLKATRATGGATLSGEVRNDGRRFAGATVRVIDQGGVAFNPTSDETDGQGQFQFALAYGADKTRLNGTLSISAGGLKKKTYQIKSLSLPRPGSVGAALAATDLTTATIDLAPVAGLPAVVAETFRPSLGWSTVLSDGTRIQIPPGAVPLRDGEQDRARVVVAPVLALPGSAQYREAATYGISIDVIITSSKRPIAEGLAIPAQIVLPYSFSDLANNGATPLSARPAIASGELWTVAPSYLLDQTARTFSFQTTSLGTWALVRPQTACSGCVFLPMVRSTP